MPQAVGIGLRYLKTRWFDSDGLTPVIDDVVIVKTDRGEEMGIVRESVQEIADNEFEGELTPVIRIATQDDLEYALELGEKEKAALVPFRELIEKNELEMKPIDIEYLFGGDKIIFYFSSENRVDFRQLVKDLATHFHSRIDMRQMGSRDQARMVGGLGRCGDELCCSRFSGDFEPVSIRMAKAQGLPPNPTKISGACGRLMCCLRYEVEAYQDFTMRAPKKGSCISTPRGEGEVVELDALREMVKLRFREDEDSSPEILDVPLSSIRCALGKKCKGHGSEGSCCANVDGTGTHPRPCEITKDAFAELETIQPEEDLFAPLPIIFKEKISGGRRKKKGRSEDASGKDDAAPRKSRRRGGRRRSKGKDADAQGQGAGTQAQDTATGKQKTGGKQSAQQTNAKSSKSRNRRRRPRNKDGTAQEGGKRTQDSRRTQAARKGDGGTETNVRETKRVPRRRSR